MLGLSKLGIIRKLLLRNRSLEEHLLQVANNPSPGFLSVIAELVLAAQVIKVVMNGRPELFRIGGIILVGTYELIKLIDIPQLTPEIVLHVLEIHHRELLVDEGSPFAIGVAQLVGMGDEGFSGALKLEITSANLPGSC